MAIDPQTLSNGETVVNGHDQTGKIQTAEDHQANGHTEASGSTDAKDEHVNGIENGVKTDESKDEKSIATDKAEKENKDSESKTKSKPIVRFDEYWDMRSFSWKLRKSAKPEKKKGKQDSVIVVRRRIDHKGRHFETAIDLHSPIVADVLNEINKNVQRTKLKQQPPVADLKLLYHSLSALEKRLEDEKAKETPDAKTVEHLTIVVDFVKEEESSTISTVDGLLDAGEITWELLWALFQPNTKATHFHELTEQQIVLVTRWTDVEKRCDGRWFKVACDIVNDDGVSFGLAQWIFEIKEFEGANRIQDLTILPLKFHAKQDSILEDARARAKRFVKMTGHQYMDVSGSAMREIRSSRHEPRNVRFFSFGKMVVDPKSFRLFVPDAEYNCKVYQALDRNKLDEDQLAICTPIVFGYCFNVKQWGGYALDRCSPVEWEDNAFPSLVLSQERKDMVRSLVKTHSRRKAAFDDVVRGKGRGLIGLLSGKPGSGKTMTAEAVSQLTRMPLYTVSAGELGEKPQEVDEKLTMILALAVTWDAVVLLDEADVFMQTRDDNNVTRNALVSIFLRQLEYFEGILILTTNRIGNIDPAFESRIHFSFHYPDLDYAARRQIWSMFWRRAGAEGAEVVALPDDDLSFLAERPLNGRQIKNTVASALSLALEDGVAMESKHARTVLGVIGSWEEAVAAQDKP